MQFEYGNGRTGRLLINFELLKNGLLPIVIPEDKRTEYFEFLNQQDSIGLGKFFEELNSQEHDRISQFELMKKKR